MKKKTNLVLTFTWLLCMTSLSYSQNKGNAPEVSGTIVTGPTIQLLTVAIGDFRLPTGFVTPEDSVLAIEMKNVLRNDLAFSLYFNVVQPDSAFLADFAKGKMNLDDWIYLGAQMLISGRIEREADGMLFTADVTDIARNKNVYTHDFVGEPQNYRYIMHQAANDILYNLTGEEGAYFSKIVYASDASGHFEIWNCDFDGYAPTQITHDNNIDIIPSWSNDRQKIYFTSYKKDNPDLYVYDLTTAKSTAFSARTGINTGAVQSPDGKYIAATLSMGGDAEVYLLDSMGRILKRLTFSKMIDTAPSWSPTSREVAFTSDRTGLPQVYITDTDGLNTRRLTFQGDYNDQPAWSPKGDLVAYSSRERDGFQIYTVNVVDGTTRKLTYDASNEGPSWSPDGLHIVYASDATGPFKLMVMDYNGMNKRQLDAPGNCKTPKWSENIK
jgi:TolB protein